jgi:serine/threonine-protein kinase
MAREAQFEAQIQALLDGRSLAADVSAGSLDDPLRIIDAIASTHRVALFGKDVPLDRPPTMQWGHLETRGEIGRGGNATVYRAWDTRLARDVALKLFAPDVGQADALEEGRLLARLRHTNIVTVYGADTHDGFAGIWMELLEGDTLDSILARDGPFSAEETLLIGLDLARALSAVHAAGLLHRDVKARNVVRERGGRVVLMDLGAGRTAETIPAAGDGTGTPMYMAPEVLAGGSASVRSDIYCLGVLLYRLLTRAFPTAATDLAGLRAQHAAGNHVRLDAIRPDLDPEVVDTIERAIHADPDARFQSASDLEAALATAFKVVLTRRASVNSPMTRALARWKTAIGMTAAAIVLLVLTTLMIWDRTPGRAARRALGRPVPPRSTLYLALNGGLGIVRKGRFTLVPYNPFNATTIAVSSDLGVRTASSMPPWNMSGAFRLDGTPVASPPVVGKGLCCWVDGATDGDFNYSARQDSTLLEPIGSRPLAPVGLYRFSRDWSNPELLFPLTPDSVYNGVAYSAVAKSFFLTKRRTDESVIEQWGPDGRLLSTPVSMPSVDLRAVAIDPKDETLWVIVYQNAGDTMRFENFDLTGRHLGSFIVERTGSFSTANGAEFEWVDVK